MNTKLIIGVGIALAIAGCASTPKSNEALESARTIVQAAEADPGAAKYAAVDLQTAKSDLAVADAAFMRRDEPSIAQPAYMAAQNARLAQLRGAAKAHDARVAAGQAERDSIVLAARTNQVDSANRAANAANRTADAANRATDEANSARDQATQNAARLKAKPTDRGLVLTLGDVLFETGSSTLSSNAWCRLTALPIASVPTHSIRIFPSTVRMQ